MKGRGRKMVASDRYEVGINPMGNFHNWSKKNQTQKFCLDVVRGGHLSNHLYVKVDFNVDDDDRRGDFYKFMRAVREVSQDDGFMEASDGYYCGFGIGMNYFGEPVPEQLCNSYYAGKFFFDTFEHAFESAEKHQYEWKIIYGYKWGKQWKN